MDSESEVPPPSLYATSKSKERTILLKKMAQKQQHKESTSSLKSKIVSPTPPPAKFDEKSIDALKKEIGFTCDCVAEISLTIKSIGETIKTDIGALKSEFDSKCNVMNDTTDNNLGALKNEFDSRFDVINETTYKQAQKQINMEVAITELYKKVQFIEQILISSDDRNNLELPIVEPSTSQKDEFGTQSKEEIKTVLPIVKPLDNLELPIVEPSTLQNKEAIKTNITISKPTNTAPQSINIEDERPKIDNNFVVVDKTGSAQTAGSYSLTINYEV
jgi:hypothetical protein